MATQLLIKFLKCPPQNHGPVLRVFQGYQVRFFHHGSVTDPIDPQEEKFSKILIANRGEIACRVIRTCRAMGIKTVAVHSDIDTTASHVLQADESVCIGPAPSNQSYLNMDAIIDAAQKTKSEAVHPGYGFLSENMNFVRKLTENNINFIGPNSKSMMLMGDKIESKKIAKEAGVNVIPGFDGIINDADHCVQVAQEIGYPVMIKASAGGGGKGMRIAFNDQEARDGFRLSSQEAASSFGDDRILVEKFIEDPRHIEIQVLCDKHGNSVHLNERECSIQRRNQKVIEEAPSSFVDKELRAKMGAQALMLSKAVDYDSVGTVEFLVDRNKHFYFLEMNTRLQVEHPITEMTTGIDLVHQMIRVAKGHKLRLQQKNIPLRGWSIEARVYAEDPFKHFGLPSIGRLARYIEPTEYVSEGVRCDSGVREGSDISIYYDPLICKLVSFGATRHEAIETMKTALDSYVIRGVTQNIPLLREIVSESNFNEGKITTNYLNETYPDGFHGRSLNDHEKSQLAAIASCIFVRDRLRASTIKNTTRTDLQNTKQFNEWNLEVIIEEKNSQDDQSLPVHLQIKGGEDFVVDIGGENNLSFLKKHINLSSPLFRLSHGKDDLAIQLISLDPTGRMKVQFKGTVFSMHVRTQQVNELYKLMPKKSLVDQNKYINAPMPGLVKSVNCTVGQMVAEGQEICIIEAMKMQNSLTMPTSGTIKKINCNPGDKVDEDQILIELA